MCTNLDAENFDKLLGDISSNSEWSCPKCDLTSTRIMDGQVVSPEPTYQELLRMFMELKADLDVTKKLNEQLEARVAKLEKEGSEPRIIEGKESMSFMNEVFEKKIQERKTFKGHPKQQISEITAEVEKVKEDIEDMKLYSRRNNLEFHGIPELKGHNEYDQIIKVAAKLKVNVNYADLDIVHRIPSRKTEMPKPILARFVHRRTRDQILEALKGKKLNTNILDIKGLKKEPIYINEHITPKMQALAKRARKLKGKGYKYVWIRNGTILIRKTPDSKIISIKSTAAMEVLERENGITHQETN